MRSQEAQESAKKPNNNNNNTSQASIRTEEVDESIHTDSSINTSTVEQSQSDVTQTQKHTKTNETDQKSAVKIADAGGNEWSVQSASVQVEALVPKRYVCMHVCYVCVYVCV
jgi:hypothetical protein